MQVQSSIRTHVWHTTPAKEEKRLFFSSTRKCLFSHCTASAWKAPVFSLQSKRPCCPAHVVDESPEVHHIRLSDPMLAVKPRTIRVRMVWVGVSRAAMVTDATHVRARRDRGA
jgi:hypothetical protein